MNKKQKMICRMWRNYKHNCDVSSEKPLYNYKIFKNVYNVESFNDIYNMKNWYRDRRVNI